MHKTMTIVVLAMMLGCDNKDDAATNDAGTKPVSSVQAAATAKVEAPAVPKKDSEKMVVDVAIGSPDHTTLVAAVKQADLVEVLASPGGVYTVFAPTNEAFAKLPAGTVDGLMKPEKKADLKLIIQHHAGVPIVQTKDMKDGQTMAMSDGTKVTFHVKDGKVMVDNANIIATIQAANGVVHVVDAVLLPPAK
jgi:uncharacterized surface protein with fasciclin (FAS1) repeats